MGHSDAVTSNGMFIISLDFELYWGARPGEETGKHYKESIRGARAAVPLLLELFKEYEIHATWATVGLLFFENRNELIQHLPAMQPNYDNRRLSSYEQLKQLGNNEDDDPLHYAGSLIKTIMFSQHQEIGTHTFSHYYCLEKGQNIETFRDDLDAVIKVWEKYGLTVQSIVFPMNQVNKPYLRICRELGLKTFRGTERSWLKALSYEHESFPRLKRVLRLIDSYVNLSGHNCYHVDTPASDTLLDISASRFLRPYVHKLRFFEPMRLRRILTSLTYAAKNKLGYHLWWHPYNFGNNLDKNLACLEKILEHYRFLSKSYGMESLNMGELAGRLQENGSHE